MEKDYTITEHKEVNEMADRKFDGGGCPECGMAYSFVFGCQFHKRGCKIGEKEVQK